MGIEKMTFLDLEGSNHVLDEVLSICMRSGIFQPEYANKLSEYSVGQSAYTRNPYQTLHQKLGQLSQQLAIDRTEIENCDISPPPADVKTYLNNTERWLTTFQKDYPLRFEQQTQIQSDIPKMNQILKLLRKEKYKVVTLDTLLLDSEWLQLLVRREELLLFLPKPMEDLPAEIDISLLMEEAKPIVLPYSKEIFSVEDLSLVIETLEEKIAIFSEEEKVLQGKIKKDHLHFSDLCSRISFLYEAYELRKYVVTLHGKFHLVGFVLTSKEDSLFSLLEHIKGVTLHTKKCDKDMRLQVPVQLKNNWLFRPFEMFVTMYGSPSYNDIDPTPFVAITYTLLFGIMFGDLGHGLCVALLGILLTKTKKMKLGPIMSRIGVSSMFFGFCYGSVFGFEHLLDPVFHAMGFVEKPIEIMKPATTNLILIAAIALGTIIILLSILFNIITGIKQKDYDRVFLSSNGLMGLVFYGSVLLGVVLTLAGHSVFHAPYVLGLIVLPLLVMFFREPIAAFVRLKAKGAELQQDEELSPTATEYQIDHDIPVLFNSQFISARFGRIPTDNYDKLKYYENEPFVLHPIKTDLEYIWLVYVCAKVDQEEIDAIYQDLFFEKILIPEEALASPARTINFIKDCIDTGGSPHSPEHLASLKEATPKSKTTMEYIFPDGVGGFITQTIFEMFEVVLSFITNTMSFLRVGGFALVHAGMMSVVFTLASMMGPVGSFIVIIIGNIFVMALEGLIVGIQALRLEFYEMFSRFYQANGVPFTPVSFTCSPIAEN